MVTSQNSFSRKTTFAKFLVGVPLDRHAANSQVSKKV